MGQENRTDALQPVARIRFSMIRALVCDRETYILTHMKPIYKNSQKFLHSLFRGYNNLWFWQSSGESISCTADELLPLFCYCRDIITRVKISVDLKHNCRSLTITAHCQMFGKQIDSYVKCPALPIKHKLTFVELFQVL